MNNPIGFSIVFILLALIIIGVCAFYKQRWAINILYASFVAWPFIVAILALLRYASTLKPIIYAHSIMLPLYVLFLACLGRAAGYRAVTQYITLLLSVFCVVILMQISLYFGWQFKLDDVYLVFGLFYVAFCPKLEHLSLFEAAILKGPRLQILNRHCQLYSQAALELAFKTHMIATMNVLFCLPLMGNTILLGALLLLGYNLFMAYHMLPHIKLPYYIFSFIELFYCAHLSSSLARKLNASRLLVNTPMTLLGAIGVLFWAYVINDYSVAYAGNIPRTGIWSGMRAGIVTFLENRYSHDRVAAFTESELNSLADHFYKHRKTYGTLGLAYWKAEDLHSWYESHKTEIDNILNRN